MWEKYQGRRSFTCVLAEWDGEQMRYINAGHLPLIQMSKPQGAQIIGHKQLPVTCGAVGVEAQADFIESVVPFPGPRPVGDLHRRCLRQDRQRPRKRCEEIEAMAEKFGGAEVTTLCHRIFDCAQPGYDLNKDDSTVVVIRRQPAAASAAAESKT